MTIMHARLPQYATPLWSVTTPTRAEILAWLDNVTGGASAWLRSARLRWHGGAPPELYCSRAVLPVFAELLGVSVNLAATELLFRGEQ